MSGADSFDRGGPRREPGASIPGPHVEVIYADPRQRSYALHLGMWIFVGSETLLFAGLFALYTGYKTWFTADFNAAIHHNNMTIGTLNTLVLVTSSFFVAWSIHLIRAGRRRPAMISLLVAMGLGLAFLAFKTFEYSEHFAEGIKPGHGYSSTELTAGGARIFFNLYYVMTGLHALHVIAGLVILGWLVSRIYRRRTTAEHHIEAELGGLYWHLVDVVWIFLWPLLYLLG